MRHHLLRKMITKDFPTGSHVDVLFTNTSDGVYYHQRGFQSVVIDAHSSNKHT